MKKVFVFVALFLLVFSCSKGPETKFFSGTFKEAQELAQKEGKLVLLNLTSGST